jgi:uncharacterized membrane protein YeiH
MHSSFTQLIDLSGTAVFALSGGLLAVRRNFDIVGVLVLSVAAGLGGGMLRDVLLGNTPPAALRNEAYLLTAIAAALVAFFFHPRVEQLRRSIVLLDALGLGFFAVSGTLQSLLAGLGPVPAVLLGVVTGAGGGVIRDLLALEVPLILRRDVYALAALVGAFGFVAVDHVTTQIAAACIGIVLTFTLRVLSIQFGWQAPRPRPRRETIVPRSEDKDC